MVNGRMYIAIETTNRETFDLFMETVKSKLGNGVNAVQFNTTWRMLISSLREDYERREDLGDTNV